MERNVIYYPYIQVPQDEWFTRTLLYWDRVSSIVPREFIHEPSRLGRYMCELLEEGLVHQLLPENYTYSIPKYTEAFMEYVDNPQFPVPKGKIRARFLRTIKVHMEKLSDIGEELVKRGLARQKTLAGWYSIEAYTANQFMAYLAGCLGQLPGIDSIPITDNAINLNTFAPEFHHRRRQQSRIDDMRTMILNDILPAPSDPVTVRELSAFKNSYRDELIRFRNRVESFLINAASIEDPSLRSESIEQFLIETRNDIRELTKIMELKGWKNISLGRFLAYSTAAFGTASAVTSGGLLAVIAAAFGAGSVIYGNILNSFGTEDLKGNYAAYAVLAKKKLS